MNTMENKKPYKKRPKQSPEEIRQEAIDLFYSCLSEYKTRRKASEHVAELLGIGGPETVQKWVRQAEVDDGVRVGTTTDENEELRRLRRENAELKRANGILKAASAFFAAELDRPQNK